MPRTNLTEAGAHTQILERKADGSLLIQVITPGWGSSGYYSSEVLEAAGRDKVWPKGTHMYFDHPSASEAEDRPERSVKDLAATLAEDAHWDGKRLVARAVPVGLGKPVLADEAFREAVGCSVRAAATTAVGEAEGRRGTIIEQIYPGTHNSVDFVTHAGRGGMILESARDAFGVEEKGELDSDRREKFTVAVQDAHADSDNKVDVWVRDYDDTTVYWERWGGDDPGTYSQTYKETDKAVELTGDPVKVHAKTTYVPVDEAIRALELTREAALRSVREARNIGEWMESRIHLGFTQVADEMFGNGKLTREERIALSAAIGAALDAFTGALQDSAAQLYGRDLWTDPDARVTAAEALAPTHVPDHPAGPTKKTRESNMPEIEEARLRQLEEASGRVPTLEAERDTANTRADVAETALAVEKARTYARDFGVKRVREANSELDSAAVDKIVAEAMRGDLPLTEADKAADRRLDTEAFGKQIDEARTEMETFLATVVQSRGGRVQGLGESTSKPEVTEADTRAAIDAAFGRTPATSSKGA